MDQIWRFIQSYWPNIQTFASLLSAGTTVMALSAAWLTFAKQSKAQRKLDVSLKQALIDALKTELEAMEPWTTEYQPDHDYKTNGAVFMRWHAPLFKPVFPIVHNTIAQATLLGAERDLSKPLTESLLVLEYQLNRFEQARKRVDAASNGNVVLAETITRKLKDVNEEQGTIIMPNDLSMPETSMMNMVFELNRVLHQECIGAASATSPNLHIAYRGASEALSNESNDEKATGCWEKIFDKAAWLFLASGIALIVISFASFSIKVETAIQGPVQSVHTSSSTARGESELQPSAVNSKGKVEGKKIK
jgi:hypothetical protein